MILLLKFLYVTTADGDSRLHSRWISSKKFIRV